MKTTGSDASKMGKSISPDLFGIFFEDLNYAADGGLYAELIQNRSFEYNATEQPTWNALSFWELTKRGGAEGNWTVDISMPVHPNNPHYCTLHVGKPGQGVGLINTGFDGIPIKAGDAYDVSLFARQLYMNEPWGKDAGIEGRPMPVTVRLESDTGEVLGEAALQVSGREWTRVAASITPSRSNEKARFVLLANAKGAIAVDEVSLFPRRTFRGRPNGLRPDLAQAIADLKPKFMRFPGGCLAHGNGLGNIYDWKDTIGPIEQRRGQRNIWEYHQSVGLGYFEYFQFCEDIGAKPLPVVAAGVSCQNSDRTPGCGQQCMPLEDMPAYIQDILDLIEWANGPATSTWGAKRAAAGHPEPFHLEYLGVGNEDKITPGFAERFKMIHDALKAKHPEITVIGTVGPFHSGPDYEAGWKLADELGIVMVDEHYYEKPEWFLNNLGFYDRYDRTRAKVYLGEYAAHEPDRKNTLRSALAEAAYMTALERNGDVVHLASYAPLLGKEAHMQWRPDLIYFTNTAICLTVNYYVQQMFCQNQGDTYLPTTVRDGVSVVRDSCSGDLILKVVNVTPAAMPVCFDLSALGEFRPSAIKTVLSGAELAENTFANPRVVVPATATLTVAKDFVYDAPPYSLTVIRIAQAGKSIHP